MSCHYGADDFEDQAFASIDVLVLKPFGEVSVEVLGRCVDLVDAGSPEYNVVLQILEVCVVEGIRNRRAARETSWLTFTESAPTQVA